MVGKCCGYELQPKTYIGRDDFIVMVLKLHPHSLFCDTTINYFYIYKCIVKY